MDPVKTSTQININAKFLKGYGFGLKLHPIISQINYKDFDGECDYKLIISQLAKAIESLKIHLTEEEKRVHMPIVIGSANTLETWVINAYFYSHSFLRIPTEKKCILAI